MRHSSSGRDLGRWARQVDGLVAVGVAVLAVACVYEQPLMGPHGFAAPGDLMGVIAACGIAVPLAWRRRWPVGMLAVATGFSLLSRLRGYATDPADFFLLFGLGSAVYYKGRRTGLVLAVLALTYEGFWWLRWSPHFGASEATWALASALVPIVIGDVLRTQRESATAVAERVDRERRHRELETARAREHERVRIARELHDIVGHHISAISVQAQAVSTLLDIDLDRARVHLHGLGALAQTALTETRASVGLLRSENGDRALQPQLSEIPRLGDTLRLSGLEVTVQQRGTPRPLDGSIELCGYRVVQEALTNVLKHGAMPARAEVVLGYRASMLDVSVISHAAAGQCMPADRGYGLTGMRERVQLAGGTLLVGARSPGMWVVSAQIPTAGR